MSSIINFFKNKMILSKTAVKNGKTSEINIKNDIFNHM